MAAVKARKKKAGDGFPLDVTANFLSQGSLVALAAPAAGPPLAAGEVPRLVLGYVKRLGKSYADVVVVGREPEGAAVEETVRLRDPAHQLIVISPDQLNSQVAEFEALKFAAAQARSY